jgi:hypothetical protein
MVPTATYGIHEWEAFDLLRSHSRRTGRKLIDLAEAVTRAQPQD